MRLYGDCGGSICALIFRLVFDVYDIAMPVNSMSVIS